MAPATHCASGGRRDRDSGLRGRSRSIPDAGNGPSSRKPLMEGMGIPGFGGVVAVVSLIQVRLNPRAKHENAYVQITNFTDSAVAPALSPDGRMVAFYRSNSWFHTPDQIYVKLLPNGEPVQLTHDPAQKYGVAFSPDGSRIAYTWKGGKFKRHGVAIGWGRDYCSPMPRGSAGWTNATSYFRKSEPAHTWEWSPLRKIARNIVDLFPQA